MTRPVRRRAAAALSLAGALWASVPAAWAQPVDPYAEPPPPPASTPPAPTPTPSAAPGADAEVDAAVAQALIARARVLAGDGAYADAKQLVVEALVRTPGDAEAKALLVELNARLGIVDAPPPSPPVEPIAPPSPPAEDLIDTPAPPSSLRQPSGFVRYAGGVAAGAVAGGLFADVVSGLDDSSAGDILGGAVLGAAAGGLAAYALTRNAELTTGDHALIDSMAAWGLIGGLTFGLALDPPEGEAYSLNGVIGIGGGYLIGHAAARKSDMSSARMVRVNGVALVGAAVPWLLYAAAADDATSDDEQAFGFLSTVGLLGGAYLGFRWTRNMAPGSGSRERDRGPTALFRHGRNGWGVGGLGLTRAQGATGAALTLVGGTW